MSGVQGCENPRVAGAPSALLGRAARGGGGKVVSGQTTRGPGVSAQGIWIAFIAWAVSRAAVCRSDAWQLR